MRPGGAQKAFFHFALESLAFCGSGVGVDIPEKVSLSMIAMVTSDVIGVSDVGAAAGNTRRSRLGVDRGRPKADKTPRFVRVKV